MRQETTAIWWKTSMEYTEQIVVITQLFHHFHHNYTLNVLQYGIRLVLKLAMNVSNFFMSFDGTSNKNKTSKTACNVSEVSGLAVETLIKSD
jgi:hypothetical protein